MGLSLLAVAGLGSSGVIAASVAMALRFARQAVRCDIGAAAGPLAGGFLLPVLAAWVIYAGTSGLAASLGLVKSAAR
jgi:hypothetical protein